MNLFIDTNIYLNFYHFTNDDLENLKKLVVAIENKKITLIVTEHEISEFRRNRENKIADAIKRFSEQKTPNQFPQICKEYDEFSDLKRGITLYERNKAIIAEKITKDIKDKTLAADDLINDLFKKARVVTTSDFIYMEAKKRQKLGNPPGKKDSLGDAINWTCLLRYIEKGDDLYIVTEDSDYFSVLSDGAMSQYLTDEWSELISSDVYIYKNLTGFFNENFPDIKLATEFEKELAIKGLAQCPNFTSTHNAISKLVKYDDYSIDQAERILSAAVSNEQVYWIKTDPDVNSFLMKIFENYKFKINPELVEKFRETYCNEAEYVDSEDIPL